LAIFETIIIMRKATRHIPVLLIALLIMVLSLTDPGESSRSLFRNFKNADKIVHLLMYFGFALTVFWSYRRSVVKMSVLMIQAFSVVLYGVLMEILQSSVTTTRGFELSDILANFSGVLLALVLFLIYSKYQTKLSS
jgi:VanZ family protein